ncbi:hypothetical protein AB0B20_17000 [Micromonospora sp. NPDC049151]|uniref:hypothetical protein n=1 Tax=Micromonospora sp. NPDC049151 TaxID=3155648 RepID=UPI0033E825DD
MTIYVVDIEYVTHTCPAYTVPHIFDTRRTVIDVIPGGPCRTPVTIRCGDTTAVVPCYRHEPADRQCGACRIIVTQHTITTRHLDEVSA